ncbi:MAG: aminotransferase class V-fold PLP-dependent enzyme [Thermoleophilia bacterium]
MPVPHDLASIRAQLPSLAADVYLNTGAAGPLSRAAADALAAWAADASRRARGSLSAFDDLDREAEETRAAAGRVVGAPADRIALTATTTGGLNVVAWGIDWRAGDEIVVAAHEHPGLSVPLAVIASRHGVRVRIAPIGDGRADLEREVGLLAGPRTRLVALSHVSWTTGAVLDVAGAARAARRVGALVLVDGAQAAGAIAVDPVALGADAYAFPAHKWLLGPEGLGALWVSRAAQERIALSASGYETGSDHRPDGTLTVHRGARRYEVSTPPAALLGAWCASLAWLEELGADWIHARTRLVQGRAREALSAIPGVRVVTPPGPQAGLVAFAIDGRPPEEACAAILAHGVVVRPLPDPPGLRASAGFFTDESDIARLAGAVSSVAAC